MNALEQVFRLVWQTSLAATVLIGLGLVVLLCFGRVLPAWARYGIWSLVFVRLMVPVAPQASFSIWNFWAPRQKPVAPVVIGQPADYQPAVRQTDSLHYEPKVSVVPMVWFAGVIGWIGVALIRHRRSARWIKPLERCMDERVISLVERARSAFRLRAEVMVICDKGFEAPAVFGVWRPRLLLPTNWVREANDEELYAVFLHEMAHVKCRDAFFNWLFIFIRSLHWFNPLVWYAFRRLRRERELFCDALVLSRLRPSERAAYGGALIRLAAQLSGSAAPATLVPVLQHQPEIHRRIHMIAKYKSTPWVLSAAFLLALIALAGLTFTRAAEKASPEKVQPVARKAPTNQSPRLDFLSKAVARQLDIVQQHQARVDDLHERLEGGELMDRDGLQRLRGRLIEAQGELARISSLYKHLASQSRTELKRSINTTSPDVQLGELMQQQALSEQKLADLVEDRAPEHPDVKRTTRVLAQINKQIEDRIDGILAGTKARMEVEQAQVEGLGRDLERARLEYRDAQQRSRPYEKALQDLRTQEQILDRLQLRLIQEQVDDAIEGGNKR
jgi:beta-lactamase regulating signal transducer with metallopeptidase domain